MWGDHLEVTGDVRPNHVEQFLIFCTPPEAATTIGRQALQRNVLLSFAYIVIFSFF